MGLANLVIRAAPALGPLFAGVVTDRFGWRAMFAIISVLSAILIVVAFFALENYGERKSVSLDIISVILSSLGLVSLLYGFSIVGSDSIGQIVVLIILSTIFLGLFVRRQLRLSNPMLDVRILANKTFRTGTLIVMIIQALFMSSAILIPLLVQTGLNHSATTSGLVLLPGAVIGSFASLASGSLFDKFGIRAPSIIGASLLLFGFAGLISASGSSNLIVIGIFSALLTVGAMFSFTPLNTWAINAIDDSLIVHGNAISNTTRQTAAAFGIAILISIMTMGSTASGEESPVAIIAGLRVAFIAAAIFSLIALVIVIVKVRE